MQYTPVVTVTKYDEISCTYDYENHQYILNYLDKSERLSFFEHVDLAYERIRKEIRDHKIDQILKE
jgi:hypothetical protein